MTPNDRSHHEEIPNIAERYPARSFWRGAYRSQVGWARACEKKVLTLAELMRGRIDALDDRTAHRRWWGRALSTIDGVAVHDDGRVKAVRDSRALRGIEGYTLPFEGGFGITDSQFSAIPYPAMTAAEASSIVDGRYSRILLAAIPDRGLLDEYLDARSSCSGFPGAAREDEPLIVRIPERARLPVIFPLCLRGGSSFYNVDIHPIDEMTYIVVG